MSNPPHSTDDVNTVDPAHAQNVSLDSLSTEEFLRVVGLRVRTQRSAMSMSRKRLAEVSGVSERYLAQLESGQGNMSIALLRKVTSAIDMSLGTLLSAETPELNSDPESSSSVTTSAGGADMHASSAEPTRFQTNSNILSSVDKLVTEL